MRDGGSGALEAWKETLGLIVLNRGFSRITRIARILRVHLFVVAQFTVPFSESRIFADYTDDADY